MIRKEILIVMGCFCLMNFITGCDSDSMVPDNSAPKQNMSASLHERKKDKQANSEYTVLVDEINAVMAKDSAKYSIYINFLDGSQPIEINSQQLRSASMIKVFIMAKAYEDIKEGKILENQELILKSSDKVGGAGSLAGWRTGSTITVQELLKLMITESDNTATNMLIELLGMDNINQYIQKHGYAETVLQRKMMDEQAVKEGKENLTSSHDLGRFFTLLYNRQVVSEKYAEMMIGLLKQQTDTECLPEAIKGVSIAHKTGELDHLYHDGGIVYSPSGTYVICILTEDQHNREKTLETMRRIAQIIEKYRDNRKNF